jgi:uncharacterized alkaline shock family protein YloU
MEQDVEPGLAPGDEIGPGRIDVAEGAIAAVVQGAVLSCYGIVGLERGSLDAAIAKRLGVSRRRRGIAVDVVDGRIRVELSVVLAHGTPIIAIARNVSKIVTFQLERALGMPVERVDVTVHGLRVGADATRVRA